MNTRRMRQFFMRRYSMFSIGRLAVNWMSTMIGESVQSHFGEPYPAVTSEENEYHLWPLLGIGMIAVLTAIGYRFFVSRNDRNVVREASVALTEIKIVNQQSEQNEPDLKEIEALLDTKNCYQETVDALSGVEVKQKQDLFLGSVEIGKRLATGLIVNAFKATHQSLTEEDSEYWDLLFPEFKKGEDCTLSPIMEELHAILNKPKDNTLCLDKLNLSPSPRKIECIYDRNKILSSIGVSANGDFDGKDWDTHQSVKGFPVSGIAAKLVAINYLGVQENLTLMKRTVEKENQTVKVLEVVARRK